MEGFDLLLVLYEETDDISAVIRILEGVSRNLGVRSKKSSKAKQPSASAVLKYPGLLGVRDTPSHQ